MSAPLHQLLALWCPDNGLGGLRGLSHRRDPIAHSPTLRL